MNKEEALHEFIKGLRIAFNNSLAYPRQHPYFLKSVEEFKLKVDTFFNFLNPIKINIAPDSLFIDGKYWVKPLAYVELAQILHQRKIKAIELRPGLDTNELADLLSALSLSYKEIIRNGGLNAILNKNRVLHISIEELDYSALLGGEGELGDVWRYLFEGAVQSKDIDRISEIADNFSSGLKNINVKDILSDDKLKDDLINFLHYLKDHDKEKFSKCLDELFSYLLSSKDSVSEGGVESLRALFKGLDEDDFADLLWSQISKEGHLDPLTLSLFSRFSQEIGPEKIAASLSRNTKVRLSLKNNPLLTKRIQGLISSPDSESMSPVYHNTLASLLKNISSEGNFSFDPKELRINYCFVLLNLLNQEKDEARARFLFSRLDKEWVFIASNKDYEYIKYLLKLIGDKEKEGASSPEARSILKNKISDFVEESAWENYPDANLDYLFGLLEKSSKGSQFYLNKMFQENKLSACGLRLFFKFFPTELDTFYIRVEAKRHDLEYLGQMVGIISSLGTNLSLVVLKRIYLFSNEVIRAEILKAMQGLSGFDKEFLLLALGENNRTLKKEALKVLFRDEGAGKEAVRTLLGVRNYWGNKNRIILENMAIIEELGFKESREYLAPFTRMNFFWHKPLKNRALNILEGWK